MGNSGEIQVLDATQAVRMRPAMFVGDTNDGTGLAHLVWEVLSNVLDQHLRGEARRVRIEVFADGVIEIEDDGAGISLCSVRCDGRPMLEDMLVTLYCGPISNMRWLYFHRLGASHIFRDRTSSSPGRRALGARPLVSA